MVVNLRKKRGEKMNWFKKKLETICSLVLERFLWPRLDVKVVTVDVIVPLQLTQICLGYAPAQRASVIQKELL